MYIVFSARLLMFFPHKPWFLSKTCHVEFKNVYLSLFSHDAGKTENHAHSFQEKLYFIVFFIVFFNSVNNQF